MWENSLSYRQIAHHIDGLTNFSPLKAQRREVRVGAKFSNVFPLKHCVET
jgi:hypothetical protein